MFHVTHTVHTWYAVSTTHEPRLIVTHMIESYHLYTGVMSGIGHVTPYGAHLVFSTTHEPNLIIAHTIESYHTYTGVMSHMSHVKHVEGTEYVFSTTHEPWLIKCEWVVSQIWTSLVSHINECHTYK